MKKQEKSIQILIDEMKEIQIQFMEFQSRRVELKGDVERVVRGVEGRRTGGITGREMWEFVRVIQSGDVYVNREEIAKEIAEDRNLVQKIIQNVQK